MVGFRETASTSITTSTTSNSKLISDVENNEAKKLKASNFRQPNVQFSLTAGIFKGVFGKYTLEKINNTLMSVPFKTQVTVSLA